MRQWTFFFLIACHFLSASQLPLLPVICVEDSNSIDESLTSLFEGGLKTILVVDAREEKRPLSLPKKGRILLKEIPFCDEATLYNSALALAKECFPKAKYVLLMDEEWRLKEGQKLKQFCQKETGDCYHISFISDGKEGNPVPRLIRQGSPVTFTGIIHPTPSFTSCQLAPEACKIRFPQFIRGVGKTLDKFRRQKKRVVDHEEYLYDYATLCMELRENEEGKRAFALCAEKTKDAEEKFLSLYHLAKFEDSIPLYLQAFAAKPTRVEPLVKIAQIYLDKQQNALAYSFALAATKIDPEEGREFDKELVHFSPYNILGISAWYIGEFDTGRWALESLIERYPEKEHLKSNLSCYENRGEKRELAPKDPRIPSFFGVDFHKGMQFSRQYKKSLVQTDPFYMAVKYQYDRYVIHEPDYQETPRIPKIIHQVWLGSPLPEHLKPFQQSWIKHHPDWEYRLWTEKQVEAFGLQNQKIYDEAKNYGEKADVVRYEILNRFGGVYLDMDMECLKPLDVFHHCTDFYVCLESETGQFDHHVVLIGNAIIGSKPDNPILKRCIDEMLPVDEDPNAKKSTIMRTGPGHLTNCVEKEIIETSERFVVFPSTYFYPWAGYTCQRNFKDVMGFVQPESCSIHYWHNSWVQ